MQIVLLTNPGQKEELLSKQKSENADNKYVNDYDELLYYPDADAFFILHDDINIEQIKLFTKPVFINSVISTLDDLNLLQNVSRINAWPTFLQRNVWEVATKNRGFVNDIFEHLGWKYLITPDKPGFVAARIIAMIINEAFFTFQEKISTKEEIDIAMKSGTNYPYGPFEWAHKIGLLNIYNLLKSLNKNSEVYKVAVKMEEECLRKPI
jgi:3-hydroxybutyryl-CoA dehydrogenase